MIKKTKKLTPEQASNKIGELANKMNDTAKKLEELRQSGFNESNIKEMAYQYGCLANIALDTSRVLKSIEFGG